MRTSQDKLAVIGIGCRFPGRADNPDSFWDLIINQRDATCEVPETRWSKAAFLHSDTKVPGKITPTRGGFIDDGDKFDATFFNISPREANQMDPQQRMLLEVSYETLEDAGIPLGQIAGQPVGVFIGISSHDYGDLQQRSPRVDVYSNTGNAQSVAANRISYFFDLHGPSVAVDTACSSALTALHYACQSLWRGECTQALVGGCNFIANPNVTMGFNISNMLAGDGRCKAFDAGADGFARGEGVGVVLIKPLQQALRDGNNIYSVINDVIIYQDGRTNGITLPNPDAQAQMLETVYRRTAIAPSEINYIECHGTGTAVGDPAEAKAIGKIFSPGRNPNTPCYIGTVKTNIGHTEAASGIAGFIKASLAVQRSIIPPNINFTQPNPDIPFDDYKLKVPTTPIPWPATDRRRRAGISSFGFGGVNAHVIIEAPPAAVVHDGSGPDPQDSYFFPFSAKNTPALLAQLESVYRYLNSCAVNLRELSYTLLNRRTHFAYRVGFTAADAPTLLHKIRQTLDSGVEALPPAAALTESKPRLAWVFSGQGPQWWKMGRELLEHSPVFREVILECDRLLARHCQWSLYQELTRSEEDSHINLTCIAQPALFATQIGLAKFWQSQGVYPDAVVGHSVGEVAAAYIAGVYTLEQAIEVIYLRSHIQHKAYGMGAMLSVELSQQDALAYLGGLDDKISIAAVNGPTSLTLSGCKNTLEQLHQRFSAENIYSTFLKVAYAFHSQQMDFLKSELLQEFNGIEGKVPTIALWSTVTAEAVTQPSFDAQYWWRNVRDTVYFSQAIDGMINEGIYNFLEISPHPVLSAGITDRLAREKINGFVEHSLHRKKPELETLYQTLTTLFEKGCGVQWPHRAPSANFIKTPGYCWQKERYWKEPNASAAFRLAQPLHPFLSYQLDSARADWQGSISQEEFPYLSGHQVDGAVVLPGAAYVDMALALGKAHFEGKQPTLSFIQFHQALNLCEAVDVQGSIDISGQFSIYTREQKENAHWCLRASGSVETAGPQVPESLSIDILKNRLTFSLAQDDVYREFSQMGLDYSGQFQAITMLYAARSQSLARISGTTCPDVSSQIHPSLLDACFQSMLGTQLFSTESASLFLPTSIESVRVHEKPGNHVWSYCRLINQSEYIIEGDILICDDSGSVLVEINGLHCQAVDSSKCRQRINNLLYQYSWRRSSRRLPMSQSNLAVQTPADLSTANAAFDFSEVTAQSFNIAQRTGFYNRIEPLFADLSCHYIINALAGMGLLEQNQALSIDQVLETGRILPKYRRFFQRAFQILEQAGAAVAQDDEHWQISPRGHELADWDIFDERLHCESINPHRLEVELLSQCGTNLTAVLKGERDPVDLIFSNEQFTQFLYRDSPTSRIYNELTQSALEQILQQRCDQGKSLRILEIGAGTGGTTAYLAPTLEKYLQRFNNAKQLTVDYCFTDISKAFLSKAQELFSDYPFISYKTLNIEQDPQRQGFDPDSFDLVVAVNVIHATRCVATSLSHINQLLAPGGALALVESTWPMTWIELVFGLTDGWWLFSDTHLRRYHPLLNVEQWHMACKEAGFSYFHPISESSLGLDCVPTQALLVAQKPEMPPAIRQDENPEYWLLLVNENEVCQHLIQSLEHQGKHGICVYRGEHFQQHNPRQFTLCPQRPEHWQSLMEACNAGAAITKVVHLWNLEAVDETVTDEGPGTEAATLSVLQQHLDQSCCGVLNLMHSLFQLDGDRTPELIFAFDHLHSLPGDTTPGHVFQAPLWGLCRTLANEHPEYRCRMIDIEAGDGRQFSRQLLDELRVEDRERELAYRRGQRYVHRLHRRQPEESAPEAGKDSHFCLDTRYHGVLENLYFREVAPKAPADHEVEVKVAAAGLNFRDVMKAMGIYPGNGDEAFFIGDEFSGTVTQTGAGVTDLQVGDQVIGFGQWCMGSSLVTSANLVAKKPNGFSMTEAATFPVIYLTVLYALEHLAKLQAGEKILIHAAAGGVGLAAVQYAQSVGAEIYATAGTDEKRQYLRSLGVEHVFDSRSLSFYKHIQQTTQGDGIDVVLNSLAGEFMTKSLNLLNEYGRFIELGKRDIYENQSVGLRVLRKNISYHTVDLTRLFVVKPDVVKALMNRFSERCERGCYRPVHHQSYPITKASEAFRTMAKGEHRGKIVLEIGAQPETVAAAGKKIDIAADGAYIITGGLGGIGILMAKWLAQLGAGEIVLMGRHTQNLPAATTQQLEEVRSLGACVTLFQGDVCHEQDVCQVIASAQQHRRLRGIFHLAMVLDDVLLAHMTPAQLHQVMAPKALGAWNLHRASAALPLDYFVMFSSMSSLFGPPGQANYVAGNYFLDRLSEYRRQLGLVGTTINWGVLSHVGYVADNTEVKDQLEYQGFKAIGPSQMLKILHLALTDNPVQLGVLDIDFERWLQHASNVAGIPQYELLVQTVNEGGNSDASGTETLKNLLTLSPQQRLEIIEELLMDIVAKVFRIERAKVDKHQPLQDLGLDSLITVEIRNWIQNNFAVEISLMELMKGGSITSLADKINADLMPEESGVKEPAETWEEGVITV